MFNQHIAGSDAEVGMLTSAVSKDSPLSAAYSLGIPAKCIPVIKSSVLVEGASRSNRIQRQATDREIAWSRGLVGSKMYDRRRIRRMKAHVLQLSNTRERERRLDGEDGRVGSSRVGRRDDGRKGVE